MVSLRRRPQRRQTRRKRKIRRMRGGNSNQVQLDVIFANGNGSITKGQQLDRSQTLTAPSIVVRRQQTANQTPNLYTLIIWDPDVPAASQPAWAHYILTDIDPNSQQGRTLLDYMPPTPPSGVHRYFFTLYKQAVAVTETVPQRTNFNLAAFVAANRLQKAAETYIKVAA